MIRFYIDTVDSKVNEIYVDGMISREEPLYCIPKNEDNLKCLYFFSLSNPLYPSC